VHGRGPEGSKNGGSNPGPEPDGPVKREAKRPGTSKEDPGGLRALTKKTEGPALCLLSVVILRARFRKEDKDGPETSRRLGSDRSKRCRKKKKIRSPPAGDVSTGASGDRFAMGVNLRTFRPRGPRPG